MHVHTFCFLKHDVCNEFCFVFVYFEEGKNVFSLKWMVFNVFFKAVVADIHVDLHI